MDYSDAQRQVAKEGWFGTDGEPSIPAVLDVFHGLTKDADPDSFLDPKLYAAWFALCERLRYLADYHERNLIRHLKYTEDYTWADVAQVVEAKLNSRQAAQQRWSRLLKDTRGKPTGRAAKAPGTATNYAP